MTEGRQSRDGVCERAWVRGESDEEDVTEGRQSRETPHHPSHDTQWDSNGTPMGPNGTGRTLLGRRERPCGAIETH